MDNAGVRASQPQPGTSPNAVITPPTAFGSFGEWFNLCSARFLRFSTDVWACFFVTLAVIVLNILVFCAPQSPEITWDLHASFERIWTVMRPAGANGWSLLIAVFAVAYGSVAIFLAAFASLSPSRQEKSNVPYILGGFVAASAIGIVIGNHYAPIVVIVAAVVILALAAIEPNFPNPFYAQLVRFRSVGTAMVIAVGLLFGLTVFFDPIAFPRVVSTWPIIYIALGFWVLVWTLSVIVWPRSWQINAKVVSGLIMIALVLFTLGNDDHRLATMSDATTDETKASQAPPRKLDEQYLRAWIAGHCAGKSPCPVVFIAAEGGGQRALYWTQAVLSGLHDEDPNFDSSIFAFSGISGGTIGGLAYFLMHGEAERKPSLWTLGRFKEHGSERSLAEKALNTFGKSDNLAPIIGALLYREAVKTITFGEFDGLDRARVFERGLESAWSEALSDVGVSSTAMHRAFPTALPSDAPALFLNSTQVETGERVVDATLDVPPTNERDWINLRSVDGGRLNRGPLSMSTAAHLSARFSYVNPHASIYDKSGVFWGRLVDGGYNDGTGLVTLLDVIDRFDALLKECQHRGECPADVHRTLIYISNDPKVDEELDGTQLQVSVSASPSPAPNLGLLPEVFSPVEAVLHQDSNAKAEALRNRIAKLTQTQGVQTFRNRKSAVAVRSSKVVVRTISLDRLIAAYTAGGYDGVVPPPDQTWCNTYASWKPELGWWLSQHSLDQMEKILSVGATYVTSGTEVRVQLPLLDSEPNMVSGAAGCSSRNAKAKS